MVRRVVGIICARKGSKRLKDKNLLLTGDGTNFIDNAYGTLKGVIKDVYIVTDYEQYWDKDHVLKRPESVSGPEVPLQDTIKWALKQIPRKYDIVVSLMPNCPDIQSMDVEMAINMLRQNNLSIVRTYNAFGLENGLIVAKYDYIDKYHIDWYTGSLISYGYEIHTKEEYEEWLKQ